MKKPSKLLLFCIFISLFCSGRLSAQNQIYLYQYDNAFSIAINMTNAVHYTGTSPSVVYFSGNYSVISVDYTDNSAGTNYRYFYELNVYDSSNTLVTTYNKNASTNYLALLTGDGRIDLSVTRKYVGQNQTGSGVSTTSRILNVRQDNTLPEISIKETSALDKTYIQFTASATDTISGLDHNSWQYSINGGALTNGKTLRLTVQAFYNIVFYVKDIVGNQNSKSLAVVFDVEGPIISITNPIDGVWSNANSVTVSATATDNVSGVNESTWNSHVNAEGWNTAGPHNKQRTITAEGSSTVYFVVEDNVGTYTGNHTAVKLDHTPPEITLTGNTDNAWIPNISRTLSAAVVDRLSGVASLELSSDGGLTWQTAEDKYKFSTAYTSEGSHNMIFKARDNVGYETRVTGRVNIDRQAPIISNFTAPIGWIKPNYIFSGVRVKDSTETTSVISGVDGGWAQVAIVGRTTVIINPGYNASAGVLNDFSLSSYLSDGVHDLTLSVRDNAGNIGRSTIKQVQVDGTPPSFNYNINGTVYRQGSGWIIPILFSGISEEHSGINTQGWKYYIDNGTMASFTPTPKEGQYTAEIYQGILSPGNHSIAVCGVDNAGNEAIVRRNFTVDADAPVITSDSLFKKTVDLAEWTNSGSFLLSAADTGSGLASFTAEVKRQQSNGTWEATGDANLSEGKLNFAAGTADGLFQILVQAVDFAKNSVGETFYAKIDRTMPAITLPSGISGSSTVSARGSDAASGLNENTWEWRPETGNWQPGKTAVLSEGRDRKFTFRVRDNAGNGAEKSGEITIDMGAPEVGALVPDYAVGGFLGVTGLYARDVLTAIKKITYQIDGNTEQELDPSSGSAAIPAGGLPEGSHRIRFNAVDSAGNTGQSAVYPFIVDKTAPVIGGIEIRDGRNKDRILEPFDYTAENEIQIRLDGQDQYRDTQGGSSAGELYNGIIRAWHWKLSREKITTAEWQETGTSEAAEFTISGLAEGINYIYLYAEDSGGNRSTVTERIVLKDSTIPGAPRIRSTTHREARRPEQADFLPEAIFRFTPAYNILSGTSYYRWQLKKVVVIDEVGRSFEDYLEGIADNPDEAGEERLFLSLEDNLENEFYRLSVQGVAGNGVTGNSGEYQFRIDSTAPNEIHIRVKPQVQSDNWYNDYDALITWNKPADMTGVAEYRYFLSADEDWTAPTPETIENYDLGNWKKTIEPAEEVNIKALLEDSLSGRIRIVVCAIDYAGNRRMGTETIQSDFEPPRFEPVAGETGLEIGDIETELGKAKRIAWGKLADNESGVDYITLFIKGDTFSRSFVLPPERDSFIADRLFDNDAYVVLVSGYDRAGNKAELVDVFVTGEREKPLSFEAPYREIVGGYTLWGKRIIGSEPDRFTDITLELPETLFINETKESVEGEIRERVKTIPFEEIEVAGTVIKGGAGREGKYTAELDGFVLEGGRLSFDRDSGLAITGGTYTRPVRLQGSARQHRFDMGTVLFGASAAPHFSSDTGSIEEAAGIETYSTDQALGTVPGFSLSKVETLQLRSGKEWFDGTGIAVYAELPAMGRHIVVANPGGGGEIELINGRAEAESRNVLGQLRIEADKPLRLLLGETEYALKKAGVRGHCIDVYEAILNLPEGYEPRELVIRNFSIDGQNGLVIKGPDFYVDPLRIPNPHGGIFESQVIEFTPDGSLYVSGAITSDIYGSFQVDLLRLDNNGADWETGARLRGFTAMVHGFAVSAADARFTGQGIYIANGSIDLHGMGRQFTGLGLRITRRDDVYESALITDSYFVQTGYGEPIGINGGSINPAGVFGRVSAPLGTGITDAANSEVWEFIETQFDPQGTMRGVLPGTREISIADHTLLAGEITLLGSLIRIGRLESQSIPGLDGDIAVFNELFFNEGGIVTAGTTNGTEVFLNAGWRIEYNNLILDSRGIGGRAYLKLPEQLGNLSIEFPDSLLSREGSFISGKAAAGYETALVYGVPVRLEAAVLESREGQLVLHCGSPVVSLSSIDGPELRFGETSFDFNGTLVQGMKGSERVRFVSSNGYRVDAASYAIGKDGIYLDGKIGAQWWNDEDKVDIGGKGIHLLPDLGVTGTGVWDGTTNSGTGRLLYQYANWPVRGGEFNFEYSRIRAGSNRIMFRGIEIELGVIQYNIRGISEGTTAIQQDIELPAINGIVVRLTETRFSHDGLEAGFSVGFPENLGGYTLHFDKINLESNGNFYVTKNIDQYQFTAGGFHFSFEKITFDSRGLYAGLAEITLPAALEQAAIRINGIRVSGSGITIENSHITPVKFWGIEFSFEDFSIKDNLVYFTGNLSLPEKLSGIIPVKPPEIRNFTVGLDGQVHHFDVRINGDYTIPFLETWNLSISDPYMEYTNGKPWVTMYNAKLLFPAGYQVREALIEKVRFNLLTGSFDYSNITANMDIRVSLGGIEFVLQNLYVSSNLSIAFNGFAQMPSFPGVPGFIAGKTLIVDVFEIRGDGSLGAISAELTDLEGEIIPGQEGFLLKNGTASIIKQGNRSVLVSIGGKLKMTSIMPAQLAGNELTIDVLTFDMAIPAVTQIKAEAFLPNPVFFGVRFSQVCLGIDWNAANQNGQFALSGGMIFPNSFPEFLAGQIAEITDFVITFDGVIKSFGAIFVSPAGEAYNAFGSVQVSDLSVMALLENGIVNCDLSGIIILPEGRFPEGIGGLKTAVRMSLDTSTGLKTLHAAAELPDKKLFGAMGMRGVKAGIHKEKNTPAVIQLSGDLLLPDTFPVGLRGMGVSIRQFTMDTTGKIIDLDIGASNIGVRIFNTVELKNASMNFRIGGYDEFLIDINGTMKLLPTSLPQSLRDAELVIGKLELSTRYGLNTFDAGINSAVSFNILGGIRVGITSMLLTESYISLNGDATLPSNYPIGLANTQIDLKTLKMGWNGDLIEIEGGIGALQINLAGFTATIKRLYFEKDDSGQYWVSLESCKIQLPYTLGSAGGEYITLKNARFNPRDGSFMGDIETTHLNIVIAGFRLELITPSIEFTNKRISCERAVLHTPAFLGNAALILSQLTISSDGSIKMSGGGIKLPAFNAGGLQFSNIGVYFELSGSQYIIGGGGSVFIPGAGTVGAILTFADRSDLYPLGFKQAEFSYTLAAGGIPLGTTGLFINGLSGGITYGPPSEVPQKVQGMFGSKGPRLKLGISIGDGSGGRLIDIKPVTWVDINNAAWAFQGDVTLLRGTLNISGNIVAALSRVGFYSGMEIAIKFVRGGIEFYIFDKSGKVIFSGEGYVQFGLAKGAIVNTKILFIPIIIPAWDMWLASINAEFGQFTNGATGFKGTVDVPVLGTVGAFVGSSGIDFGNVSGYRIEKPDFVSSSQRSSRRVSAANQGVVSNDAADRDIVDGVTWQFYIPPAETAGGISPAGNAESGLDRVVLLMAYVEGDPVLSITDPSGRVYGEGKDDTKISYMENAMAFTIPEPRAGLWQIRLSGIEEEAYRLQVFGNKAMPVIEFTDPSYGISRVSETLKVSGRTDRKNETIVIKAREASGKPALELGNLSTGNDGGFEATVPVSDLPDGEYRISAEFSPAEGGLFPPVYAPGRIVLDRSAQALAAPGKLRAAETDPGIVSLHWENTNGGRTAGYNLKVYNRTADREDVFYLGNITALTLPGYDAGQDLSFSVSTLDDSFRESEYTGPVHLVIGREKPAFNRPAVAEAAIRVVAFVGGAAEGTVRVDIRDYRQSEDSSAYITARQIPASEGSAGYIRFGGPVQLTGNTAEIPWHWGISGFANSGIYTYPCEVLNEADGSLSAPFVIEITLSLPKPEISRVEPVEVIGDSEQTLTIYGSGFTPGTRVLWQGEELPLVSGTSGLSPVVMDVRLPAQTRAGEYRLTLVGPENAGTASYPVTVVLPGWRAVLYTRTAETVPGGTVDYPVGIGGLYGFEGAASFTVTDKAPELTLDLPVIPVNQTGMIRIRVGDTTAPGTYKTLLHGDGGQTIEFITIVAETPPKPRLSSLSPASGYTGTQVHVYGYGFDGGGKLYLNGEELDTLLWTENEIVFTVPGDGTSGTVFALTGRGESNALPFTLRDRGFTLRTDSRRVSLTPGEAKTLRLFLSGYADLVQLKAEVEPGAPLTAVLGETAVVPNAMVDCTITVDPGAGNGTWKILVRGNSRGYETNLEFTVYIGNAFVVEALDIPEGLVDVSYYGRLTGKHGTGEITYQVVRGDLPPGLELNRQGEISGYPRQTGRYQVWIEGRDEAGHSDTGAFTIPVNEELWGQRGKDGGRSMSVATNLPANDTLAWTYRDSTPAEYILAAKDRIIAVSAEGITALRLDTGKLVWTLPGTYKQVSYAGGHLYALSEKGLETRDPDTGLLLWEREGIGSFSTDGTLILADDGSRCLVIDGEQGLLLEVKDRNYHRPEQIIWKSGGAYGVEEKGIIPIHGAGPRWETEERIIAAAADAEGLIIATEESLVLLDRNHEIKARLIYRPSVEIRLALADDGVLVLDRGIAGEYSRKDLEARWSRAVADSIAVDGITAGSIAAGRDKAVVAGLRGLMVLNRFTGNLIWEAEKPCRAFALYHEKIVSSDSEGRLSVYNGAANTGAPETVIQIRPALPDGKNGWYVTSPVVLVESLDRETYVEENKVFVDDTALEDPENDFSLPDGEYQIRAYGVDSMGLRGEEVRTYVKIDTGLPESDYTLSLPEPQNGWFNQPVTISLEGWDEVSQLDRIWTSLGLYADPVLFAGQGIHNFYWYAIDRAGNTEKVRNYEFKIDLEPPYAEASVLYDAGIAEVTIRGWDGVSGIDGIEYRINGGLTEQYGEPLWFTEEGRYRIQYRIKDKAGNHSEWLTRDVLVAENRPEVSLIDNATLNGRERMIMYNVRNGMPVLRQIGDPETKPVDKSNSEALLNLPSYAIGGEYLLWEAEDVPADTARSLRFRVSADAVVYLFVPQGAEPSDMAPYPEWSFVEGNIRINRAYYPGGTGVYMKRVSGGSWVTVNGIPGGMAPPLVVVQERGAVYADITIRRESNTRFGDGDNQNPASTPDLYEGGSRVILEAAAGPWQYSRRLPLRKRWFVSTDEGWLPIEGNRYELPEVTDTGYLRFRVEVYTPDGQTEYRTEKAIDIEGH